VAQCKRVIAGAGSHRRPGIPLERLAYDLRNQFEGGWNAGDKAKLGKMGDIVLTVEFGISDERAWARRGLEGAQQRLSPLLANPGICGVAGPTLAHKGDATVLRHQQCPHGLLEVRPVVLRVAVGKAHGMLIAVGDVGARETKAGRVELIAAQIDAFARPDCQRQFLKQ
jgi:hypothetical protein